MLVIENDGEIEVGALTLMGATTKEGDDAKIGFFGSGNKYAMTTLLRKCISFSIYSGTRKIDISTRLVNMRGVAYRQVYIDGQATSMTTRMGPTWEVWFAIREFICNAKDEGGFKMYLGEVLPESGKTKIAIDDTCSEVQEFYLNQENYILGENEVPLDEVEGYDNKVQIYENQDGKFRLYRKGIAVNEVKDLHSLFRYNMQKVQINESRIYSSEYDVQQSIMRAIFQTKNIKVVDAFVKNWQNVRYKEHTLNFEYYFSEFSPTWEEYLKDKIGCALQFKDSFPPEDQDLYVYLPNRIAERLSEAFENLNFVGKSNTYGFVKSINVDAEQLEKLEECKTFVLRHMEITKDIPVIVGRFSATQVIACCEGQKKIMFSESYLNRDSFFIQQTLMEEYYHSKGYADGSRAFEDRLMSDLLRAWLKEEQE